MSELERIAQEDCELEMTPMIDVTFLLLIFFICTIKFKTLEGKLSAFLPKDVGVNPELIAPIEKFEVVIKVVNEGTKLDPNSAAQFDSRDPNQVAHWNGIAQTRFVFGDDRQLQYKLGPHVFHDLHEFEERLTALFSIANPLSDTPPALTIDPRSGTVYEDVVSVLDCALNAEFTDVTFVGSYEH